VRPLQDGRAAERIVKVLEEVSAMESTAPR
jgi:hypothetical protein